MSMDGFVSLTTLNMADLVTGHSLGNLNSSHVQAEYKIIKMFRGFYVNNTLLLSLKLLFETTNGMAKVGATHASGRHGIPVADPFQDRDLLQP